MDRTRAGRPMVRTRDQARSQQGAPFFASGMRLNRMRRVVAYVLGDRRHHGFKFLALRQRLGLWGGEGLSVRDARRVRRGRSSAGGRRAMGVAGRATSSPSALTTRRGFPIILNEGKSNMS